MEWETSTSILARLETFSAETAWASLAEHFERPLMAYARRSGLGPDAVPDVVQEVLVAFADAYRRGKYDRERGRLSGWLFGIARREVAAARRNAALDPVQSMGSNGEPSLPVDDETLERVWEEEWQRALLQRCIEVVRSEVEPTTWECFALQTFEGLDAGEVAARIGVTRTRVYNAKHRVARRLRQLAKEFEGA